MNQNHADIAKVRGLVAGLVTAIGQEVVDVIIAKNRVTAEAVIAPADCPSFDEATRDGYVLADSANVEAPVEKSYAVCGEIAAGAVGISALVPGTASRIYTGAMVPKGARCVVPLEYCHEVDGILSFSSEFDGRLSSFIRKKASDVCRGQVLVDSGEVLQSEQISLLVALQVKNIRVSRLPIVACYCTGSELLEPSLETEMGQKSSINGWVMADLLPRFGGVVMRSGLLADNAETLKSTFVDAADGSMDMVVTTGGLGPGKFDLVRDAFVAAGGQVILESLPMRPGKSILLGLLNGVICIGLPGPPNAVRTLINELVGPVLNIMQGVKKCWPKVVQAELLHDLKGSDKRVRIFKSGILEFQNGKCCVRLAGKLEPATCGLIVDPKQNKLLKGDLVTTHLLR